MKQIEYIIKLIIITSILAFGNLSANEFILEDIVKAYKSKDYKTSYEGFLNYLKDNPSNKRISFMYGRSAYEMGKYEEALASYEKVLLEEPSNLRARLEIAQSYYALEKYDKAKESYESVLQEDIPQNVRDNINLKLSNLENDSKKHFFKAVLMTGISYDSNINNDSEASIYVPFLDRNYPLANKKSDVSAQVAASLNHKYKINNKNYLENKLAVFTQRYFDYQDNDIDVFTLGTGLGHYKKDMKLFFGVDYNNARLDDSKYLDLFTLKTNIRKKINSKISYFGEIKFIDKNYAKNEDQDRDSNVYELQNSLSFSSEDYGLNTLTFLLGKESRQRGVRTDVENDYIDLKFLNRYSFSKTLILDSSIDYRITNYDYEDAFFLTKRENKKFTFSLGVLKALDKNISIGFGGSYINHNSNHEPFEYDKYKLRTNLYYTF